MAPLPQNSTARVFLDYVTGSAATAVEHTMAFRVGDGVEGPIISGNILDFLASIGMAKFRAGWKPLRLRYQAAATNFSVPLEMSALLAGFLGTGGASGYNDLSEAIEFTFQGRSYTTGRRVDISVYGIDQNVLQFPRFLPGSAYTPWLSATLTVLNGESSPFLAIDGTKPVWYPYVNGNYNSYWESRARR